MYEIVPVPGFDNYMVSSAGEVFSLQRKTAIEVRGCYPNTGYRQVMLYRDGKGHPRFVHRLVADVFCSGFAPGLTVDHINNDKNDNRAENLRWMSLEDNINRRKKSGLPRGVARSGDSYQAQCCIDGVVRWSRRTKDVEEAAMWYRDMKAHGGAR